MNYLDHVAELMAQRPKRENEERSFVVLRTEERLPPAPVNYDQPTERRETKPR